MRHFRKLVLLRLVIITLLLSFGIYFYFVDERLLRSIYLLLFTILAITELYWYIDRINRNVSNFLTALMQNDFTTSFTTDGNSRSFRKLHETFNLITYKFKELTAAQEARHQYLEALVSHVNVGIISYDQNEKIMLINQAFRKMTGKHSLSFLHGLELIDIQLLTTIRQMSPGETRTVSITIDHELLQLNIQKTAFHELGNTYSLVSIQNIRKALSVHEIQAWQKLMRVLTHEIMNSISPITSLSETLINLVPAGQENTQALRKGLEAIQARSSGLESFTTAYRQITGIPAPKPEEVNIGEFLERILRLMQSELSGINIRMDEDTSSVITADPGLLGQVIINLVRNAADALEQTKDPVITISWAALDNGTQILIADNGPGIPPDKMDHIFIPFYTTKKHGSGIGLAVSQQIIQLHKGSIDVKSAPGHTLFRILLPE